MKNILLISAISILIISSAVAQDYPKTRYLNVKSDKNIRIHTNPEFCLSCSESNFIVDGNESKGYVELNFSGINSYGQAKKAELIMNVPDVNWAESGDGISVFYKNEKIGNINTLRRNSYFLINLNTSLFAGNENVKLVLKANGNDGLYLMSKKSGFGAVLKLQY